MGFGMGGLGTTLVFVLIVVLWLAYLLPVWVKRREYAATERNAVRLQQTLRIMAETAHTPEVVHVSSTSRDVLRTQKIVEKEQKLERAKERAEAVAKARELDREIQALEAEAKRVAKSSVSRVGRLRRTRLACTALLLVSIAAGVLGVVFLMTLWPLLILGTLGVVSSFAGLALVAATSRGASRASVGVQQTEEIARIVRQPQSLTETISQSMLAEAAEEPQVVERSWTPAPLPAPLGASRTDDAGDDPVRALRAAVARAKYEADAAAGLLAPVQPIVREERAAGVAAEAEVVASAAAEAAASRVAAPAVASAPAAPKPAPKRTFDSLAEAEALANGGALDVSAALRRRVS
ncbi:hypothetical protein [Humidisolicoccus flavus]|uniref:hypothetical protein n=1 Tax=Humidisolicoccus flavus TaxID=3111414 RepID=UPI003253713B